MYSALPLNNTGQFLAYEIFSRRTDIIRQKWTNLWSSMQAKSSLGKDV